MAAAVGAASPDEPGLAVGPDREEKLVNGDRRSHAPRKLPRRRDQRPKQRVCEWSAPKVSGLVNCTQPPPSQLCHAPFLPSHALVALGFHQPICVSMPGL